MTNYKEWRLDSFSDLGHEKQYFDTEEDARAAADSGKENFLLKLLIDGTYDVIEQI